ncbi:hypothetical protein RFI_00118 [Reticulomyxa filosa]|uniref:Uncharacterized protein n=1 Tax=Reticulomyxa filosa TaxID=46433 RepID=X6PFH0_RETFI|nr:hypothetical protein RFI_00118 [Reticulomyxa filosa]|eukprot:ETO36946.1 hypothetical protein RFI_00118 [Reticulomyxa filosa]
MIALLMILITMYTYEISHVADVLFVRAETQLHVLCLVVVFLIYVLIRVGMGGFGHWKGWHEHELRPMEDTLLAILPCVPYYAMLFIGTTLVMYHVEKLQQNSNTPTQVLIESSIELKSTNAHNNRKKASYLLVTNGDADINTKKNANANTNADANPNAKTKAMTTTTVPSSSPSKTNHKNLPSSNNNNNNNNNNNTPYQLLQETPTLHSMTQPTPPITPLYTSHNLNMTDRGGGGVHGLVPTSVFKSEFVLDSPEEPSRTAQNLTPLAQPVANVTPDCSTLDIKSHSSAGQTITLTSSSTIAPSSVAMTTMTTTNAPMITTTTTAMSGPITIDGDTDVVNVAAENNTISPDDLNNQSDANNKPTTQYSILQVINDQMDSKCS